MSPIIEISECTRALERPANWLYQWNFVRDLKRRMRRKERCRPGLFDLSQLNAIKTVREFDEAYTAPYFGFRSAEDYYHRASAMRVIDRVRVPALDHHRRRRSVRAVAAVPRSEGRPATRTSICAISDARRPLRVRRRRVRRTTMATGRKGRLWSS